jgi:alcohol dehydrogenase class IV
MEEAAEYARQRELDGSSRSAAAARSIRARRSISSRRIRRRCSTTSISRSGAVARFPVPLKPLIAVPTTAGTGSETTAVAVTHVLAQHVKAGVSTGSCGPALGIVDPLNTLTAPPEVTAAAGCRHPHARDRVLHDAPVQRSAQASSARPPAYIGANPASDIWCEKAIEYVGRYLRRAC